MKITYKKDPLIDKCELNRTPVIIRVNKFDEKSAQEFSEKMSDAEMAVTNYRQFQISDE